MYDDSKMREVFIERGERATGRNVEWDVDFLVTLYCNTSLTRVFRDLYRNGKSGNDNGLWDFTMYAII